MTQRPSPVTESQRSVQDRLADIYTWIREPDTIEVASLDWLMDWVDRRPVADLAMVAMLMPSPQRMPMSDRDEIYEGSDLNDAEVAIARRLVLEKPSPSYLQRKMSIPYSHAMRLIGLFEAEQIITLPNSAGLRRVVGGSPKP